MMSSFRDTRAASPPTTTRYRAADYHPLTNRRASSPPSPDLETAHELALQHTYRQPVVTPDKRASTALMHTAPCTYSEESEKSQIRQTPRACVKEESSCRASSIHFLSSNRPLTTSRCDQLPPNPSLNPSTPPSPPYESLPPTGSSTMSTSTTPVLVPVDVEDRHHGDLQARREAEATPR